MLPVFHYETGHQNFFGNGSKMQVYRRVFVYHGSFNKSLKITFSARIRGQMDIMFA